MAEAFGVIGSAVGVISFGLQVFKEVSRSIDDVDGRDEDLQRARNYAQIVQTSLAAFDNAVSRSAISDPRAKQAVEECTVSCVAAVRHLKKLVEELKAPVVLSSSHTARARELCAKWKYPFKKQNLEKLEEQLIRTNSMLQTALNLLQLHNANAARDAIASVQQMVNNIKISTENHRISLEQTNKTSIIIGESLCPCVKNFGKPSRAYQNLANQVVRAHSLPSTNKTR